MTSRRMSSGASNPNGAGVADVQLEDPVALLLEALCLLQDRSADVVADVGELVGLGNLHGHQSASPKGGKARRYPLRRAGSGLGSVCTMPLAASSFAGLTHLGSGKVRELFVVGEDTNDPQVLLVASDRISAYDVILPTEIPDKGAVLTALSLWWFEQLADIVPSHVVTAKVEEYPDVLQPYAEQLRHRSMLCRRLDMVQVECVVRGYLTGSGLKDYQRTGRGQRTRAAARPARTARSCRRRSTHRRPRRRSASTTRTSAGRRRRSGSARTWPPSWSG